MEQVNFFSTIEDVTEAIRGSYGKDITNDCRIAYLGTVIIGQTAEEEEDTTILDKHCKSPHYEWIKIGDKLYLAFIK